MEDKIITDYANFIRGLYVGNSSAGEKVIRAVNNFIRYGQCDSNAEEDSVCGGSCNTCYNYDSDNLDTIPTPV